MALGNVQIADVIVPAIFNPYVQELTQEKTAIINAGAAIIDPTLTANLAGEGSTFNVRSFKDLQNDAENVSSDSASTFVSPAKIGSATEIQIRLSRNAAWSSMDLTTDLIAKDPIAAIGGRVANYWIRRLQLAVVSVVKGVFANNDLSTGAVAGLTIGGVLNADTHIQGDMTFDASGSSFVAGVTNFTAEAFIDATLTMGDSLQNLSMIMVHSVVYGRMIKNNLIDFIPDSSGSTQIPTFMGRTVVVDDGMPFSGGVFESWIFGAGALLLGMAQPKVPSEIYRLPTAGNGAGMETLINRVEWAIHPCGYSYQSAYSTGGPTNANLATATNWARVFPERKQIRIARLKTREF